MRAVPTFYGFAGQTKVVAALREQIDGAVRAGTTLPHVLLSGTSGSGKTHLSRAVARAMGTKLHEVYCSDQTTRARLAEVLSRVNTADCVYLDEVHALRESVQELLYPAVDRLKVPVVQDGRIIEGDPWRDIKPFTLILSTDQPAKTRNALLQRVPLRFHLGRYTEREMRVIVANYAAEIGVLLSSQATTRLAEVSRGLPRTARHRLQVLKTAIGMPDKAVTKTQVEKHLELHGIDRDNLTAQDRHYLTLLAESRAPMSLQTLALRMGLDDYTLRREVETYLTLRGWVSIEPRGRCLTERGMEYVNSRGFTE